MNGHHIFSGNMNNSAYIIVVDSLELSVIGYFSFPVDLRVNDEHINCNIATRIPL